MRGKQKGTFLKVLNRIKKYWFYLGVSLLLTMIAVAGTLYLPILTGKAVDHIVDKGMVDFEGLFVIFKSMIMFIAITA